MFLFIVWSLSFRSFSASIQIHLMFLFITTIVSKNEHCLIFKYISCSYLSLRSNPTGYFRKTFKYISCSYLSHPPPKGMLNFRDSNTSHVLIYRSIAGWRGKTVQFKYISCSYLSNLAVDSCAVSIIQIHLMFLFISKQAFQPFIVPSFKYISCSYLSAWKRRRGTLYPIQIHLMFLFIAQNLQVLHTWQYSNTSHVLIYQRGNVDEVLFTLFKYISCSYLSRRTYKYYIPDNIQIHLMFLFISVET